MRISAIAARLSFGLIMSASCFAQETSPDYQYESFLHDIYLNYYSQPTSATEWKLLTEAHQAETYLVQPGDSLWEVSKTLFNDGTYWPKIWSINSTIANPHIIEPGEKLSFVAGTMASGPSLGRSDANSLGGTTYAVRDVEIPPPLYDFKPVIKNLPPSLPAWEVQEVPGKYDELGMEFVRRPRLDAVPYMYLEGYVDEPNFKPIGEIVEIEGSMSAATDMQHVYIRVEKGSVGSGNAVTAVYNRGSIQKVNSFIESNHLGVDIEVQGGLRVGELIKSADFAASNSLPAGSYDVFRALVEKSINNIRVGSLIIPGELRRMDMSSSGSSFSGVAQVIGGLYHTRRHLFGIGGIVFLNRGSSQGFQEGQILPVRAVEALRKEKSIIDENIREIGTIKIVRVTPNFSTAVVLAATEEIRSGDVTGQGQFASSVNTSQAEWETQRGEEEFLEDEFGESEGGEGSVELFPGESSDEDDFLFEEDL